MNNQATLIGRISSEFTYDHEMYGEKYYRVTLSVMRDSGTADNIPVIVSERLLEIRNYYDEYVAIKGQFRSYNLHGAYKNKLLLFIFAQELEIVEPNSINDVFIEGFITKPPTYRLTPMGRVISDFVLGVHREYGKCDYIPCICWSRIAKYVSGLRVGCKIRVVGRVQSREYVKNGETKIAYELSVNLLEVVDV